MKGPPGQGRPKTKKDSKKRKTKVVKPRGKASELFNTYNWTTKTQSIINDMVMPGLLKFYNKSNARQLSNSQTVDVENIKFNILLNTKAFTEIKLEDIYEITKILLIFQKTP